MKTLRFEYFKDGSNRLLFAAHLHPIDSFLSAFKSCGWEARLTLKLMSEDGRTEICNWFEFSSYLPILTSNYESDYKHYKKSDYWIKFM